MVEMSGFDREKKEIILETHGGKIRISFDEWHHIVVMYNKFIAKENP